MLSRKLVFVKYYYYIQYSDRFILSRYQIIYIFVGKAQVIAKEAMLEILHVFLLMTYNSYLVKTSKPNFGIAVK